MTGRSSQPGPVHDAKHVQNRPSRRPAVHAARWRRRRSGCESGQVTAFVIIMTLALLLAAGLVYDGGLILAAKRQAINEAEAAARAGTQALDIDAYRASGTVHLEPDQAIALASRYLAETGHPNTVTLLGDDQVEVSVEISQPVTLLGLGGLGTQTVTGHATAHAVAGVEEAEP